ncbi:hypothetical protein HWV23_04595 [Natronomonas halophila]|uniref:hypothetical protein n=1 Tax=Natronomonas halophila TaxID=2747817 RepID=UPI0015B3F7DB|nr:hypothetical protein [Natronomonas halophila]QLD85028.1 hypothetical protein HWV23_04595 [Natronomonas halophila]
MDADGDPFSTVALVVGSLAFVFAAVLVAVQLAGRPEGVLTLPLVIVIPAVLGLIYWYVRYG